MLQSAAWSRTGPGLVGLVGPNGSGKTSLLRLVAQLLEPDHGSIEVCGIALDGGNAQARRLVGFAPHEPIAYAGLSVIQNLEHAARLAGERPAVARHRAGAVMERWQLEAVGGHAVRALSRGWAQRYSMARADLLEPPIVLLDEPTTGLDDEAREALEAVLDGWHRSRLVLVSSHEHAWLASRCDEVLDVRQLTAPAALLGGSAEATA